MITTFPIARGRETAFILLFHNAHAKNACGSALIRGLGSNQILILVDGIRLNHATYRLGNHQYLTTVDDNMLAQIEVVRGPNSVLYGSDALGGTINLITRQPSFSTHGTRLDYRWLYHPQKRDLGKLGESKGHIFEVPNFRHVAIAQQRHDDSFFLVVRWQGTIGRA